MLDKILKRHKSMDHLCSGNMNDNFFPPNASNMMSENTTHKSNNIRNGRKPNRIFSVSLKTSNYYSTARITTKKFQKFAT